MDIEANIGKEQGRDVWADMPKVFRAPDAPLAAPWDKIFGPLRKSDCDDFVIVGQIGQSLDGRIATESGNSHYINGPEGLAHLHRLRALVDVVVVGVGTAVADDPQLTVRRVQGPNPARVVIDPRGRMPRNAKLWADDGTRRLIVTATSTKADLPKGVEIVTIETTDGRIAPAAIVEALAIRGFHRILIEGGAQTVSTFIAARCLDRLHVVVAPIILGSGRSGINLSVIQRVNEALRPTVQSFRLGDEVLFDCDLSAYRAPIGYAKKST